MRRSGGGTPSHSLTASWRLGGQAVTLIGGVLAGVLAGLLGNDPRPVIAGPGASPFTVAVAWFAGLRKEHAAGVAGIRFLD